MTSTALRPQPGGAGSRPAAEPTSFTRPDSMSSRTDLERFWPSRRGHAFDEFCR